MRDRDGGRPILNAAVVFLPFGAAPFDPWYFPGAGPEMFTGSDGSFRIEGVAPGRYEARIFAIGRTPERAEVIVTKDGAQPEIAMVQGPSVRGRVVDIGGEPSPGVEVVLVPGDARGEPSRWFLGEHTVTDASGAFRFQPVPAGRYRLAAFGHPREAPSVAVTLGASDVGATLVLARGPALTGLITGLDLARVSPARALLFGPGLFFAATTADRSGRFDISELPSGASWLVVEVEDSSGCLHRGAELVAAGPNEPGRVVEVHLD